MYWVISKRQMPLLKELNLMLLDSTVTAMESFLHSLIDEICGMKKKKDNVYGMLKNVLVWPTIGRAY